MSSTEKMQQVPSWDDMTTEKLDAVNLSDNEEHTIVFLSDEPREVENKFGKRTLLWTVEENKEKKLLFVSAIKLGFSLKKLAEENNNQLSGLAVSITGSGEGTARVYEVKKVGGGVEEKFIA